MTDEELKKKCKEREKIFQQAMESCHSSNPIDCIEWFADRITELEKMLAEQYPDLKKSLDWANERESEDVKRIAELEEKISVLLSCKNCPENKGGLICEKEYENKCLTQKIQYIKELEKENAELRKVAEFQQSSNMNTHLENKKLKEGLAVGSTLNKGLNSLNKALEEERDKYRNMVFDKDEQLTKAKDHIKKLLDCLKQDTNDPQTNYYVCQYMDKAEQFLNSEIEK